MFSLDKIKTELKDHFEDVSKQFRNKSEITTIAIITATLLTKNENNNDIEKAFSQAKDVYKKVEALWNL